ncbi:hypothetical protein DEM34_14225 [Spiribacter halobius]|uniref:Aminoglycoside phosphotransferase domain-containing protein n=2 Tax=Sediminicurvatus halobius TaxID=2182432 RepID=A0A2U2MYK9_9GAMM|nr:hypothetical protein DEM34_14225 [Spiribacter halobius]
MPENPCMQRALVDWLQRPDAHGGAAVEHVETQISHVFLAGDHVYKLKKADAPAFLDYGTPERRRHAAETELAVNRRTAPHLYEAVIPVRRYDGGFTLGEGNGEPVDWLVVMRRFEQADLFHVMAREGRLSTEHVVDLADAVADLHAQAGIRRDHGGAEGMRHHYRVPLDTLAEAETSPFAGTALDALGAALDASWRRLGPRLEARRRHGRVRHGHGDLHLANACLFEGRATPFDAIEFSEALACTDTLYDAAFTVMDLLAHGERALAGDFLNRYLEATGDYSGLACLPLFVSVRALVRAMANGLTDDPERQSRARDYFHLARSALDWAPEPRVVAIGGLSGTGKSTVARGLRSDLAPGPGAVQLRSDGIRKRLAGVAPEARLPQQAYRPEHTRRTYRRLERHARRAALAGWPAILDATFTRPESRQRAEAIGHSLRVPFTGLWLTAPADVLRQRVAARAADASDADLAVLERQLSLDTGAMRWPDVPATGTPTDALARARRALMREMR